MCGTSTKRIVEADADRQKWADMCDESDGEGSPTTSAPARQPSFKRSWAADVASGDEQPQASVPQAPAAPKSWAEMAKAAAATDDGWTTVSRQSKVPRPSPATAARPAVQQPRRAPNVAAAQIAAPRQRPQAKAAEQPARRSKAEEPKSARTDRPRADAATAQSSKKASTAPPPSNKREGGSATKDAASRKANGMDSSRLNW